MSQRRDWKATDGPEGHGSILLSFVGWRPRTRCLVHSPSRRGTSSPYPTDRWWRSLLSTESQLDRDRSTSIRTSRRTSRNLLLPLLPTFGLWLLAVLVVVQIGVSEHAEALVELAAVTRLLVQSSFLLAALAGFFCGLSRCHSKGTFHSSEWKPLTVFENITSSSSSIWSLSSRPFRSVNASRAPKEEIQTHVTCIVALLDSLLLQLLVDPPIPIELHLAIQPRR